MSTSPQASLKSGLPLYVELGHSLRGAIVEGEWAPGERLPAETALAAKHGVSVTTIRQALSALENEGLVVRHQGRGTFVASMRKRARLRLAIPIDAASARTMTVRLISVERVDRPQHVLSMLGVNPPETIMKVRRVRLAESHPVSYAVSYIPDWLEADLGVEELNQPLLFDVLERTEGVRFQEVDQVVEATVADTEAASVLDVSVGSPLLLVRRHYYLEGGRIGYVVLNRYVSPLCYLQLRLSRTQARGGEWRIGADVAGDGRGTGDRLEEAVTV